MSKNQKVSKTLAQVSVELEQSEKEKRTEEIRNSERYNSIKESMQDEAMQILRDMEDFVGEARRREMALSVCAQIMNLQWTMENDPTHPLYILQKKFDEISGQVNTSVKVAGIEIEPPPPGVGINKELNALEKRVKALKNRECEKVAADYGFTQDEAFAIYRLEHPVQDKPKFQNQNQKKESK